MSIVVRFKKLLRRGVTEGWKPIVRVKIEEFESDEALDRGDAPKRVIEQQGNVALKEGIYNLLQLAGGLGGTAWSNGAARIGVGDSSLAANAAQTGLQGTQKTFKAMDAGFPQIAVDQTTISWRATFLAGDAQYAWNEVTISNGSDDTGANLNRTVEAKGTKGAVPWRLTVTLTFV